MQHIAGNYLGSHWLGTPYLPDRLKLIRCCCLTLMHHILFFPAAKELGIWAKVSSLDSGHACVVKTAIQQQETHLSLKKKSLSFPWTVKVGIFPSGICFASHFLSAGGQIIGEIRRIQRYHFETTGQSPGLLTQIDHSFDDLRLISQLLWTSVSLSVQRSHYLPMHLFIHKYILKIKSVPIQVRRNTMVRKEIHQ